jgi:hypothetical protein
MMNDKDTIRKDAISADTDAKRHDAEEMIEIYLKLPEAARERIRYMTEGAALTVDQHAERAAV